VHEAPDVALHVGLVARVFKLAAGEHHFVRRGLVGLGQLLVLAQVREAKVHRQVRLDLVVAALEPLAAAQHERVRAQMVGPAQHLRGLFHRRFARRKLAAEGRGAHGARHEGRRRAQRER